MSGGRGNKGGKGRGGPGGGKGRKGASKGGSRRRPPPTSRGGGPDRRPGRDRGRTSAAGVSAGGAGRSRAEGLGGDQIEGRQAVREALVANTRRIREVVIDADRRNADVLDDIVELASQLRVSVREIGRAKLSNLARTESHQGVIAFAAPLPESDFEDLLTSGPRGTAPFLLATDGVTDPGNLGALLRSAECAGVTGIVLPRHRAVHVTPAVTKAAAGAVEHLRFAVVGGLPAALLQARDAGVVIVGLDMDGDAPLHDLPPLDGPVLVVVGAEGRGLSRLTRERCDVIASIPLLGQTESLNVSVAGALALYEVVRQRGA